MMMQEKEGGYEIAAGETLTFEPGGAHIMLLDIDAATYPESVDVTLTFDDGSSIDFTAEVRAIDGGGAMTMDDGEMDDGEMDDGEMDDGEMDDMDHSDAEEPAATDG
jgi:copper(I)-binding protein